MVSRSGAVDNMLHLCHSGKKPQTSVQTPFLVGVNYWPRELGLELWKRFDIDLVHEDFANLSDLGITFARIFLLWEDFQPDPETLRCAALSHLLELCDAAAAEGLKLELVFFSGHVGPLNWVPSWLLDPNAAPGLACGSAYPTLADGKWTTSRLLSPFADPLARRAAMRLVRGVARSVGNHPAIFGYNLGNRPDLLATPQCIAEANQWFAELKQALQNVDPRHPVTCSLAGSNLTSGSGLRVDQVFASLDYACIDRDGTLVTAPANRLESQATFNCALASALAQKPAVLQELEPAESLRGQDATICEQKSADYVGHVLKGLQEQGARGAVLWWYTDTCIEPLPAGTPSLYGLFDAAGNLRPHGKVLQDFASGRPTVVAAPKKRIVLDCTPDDFYESPAQRAGSLFESYLQG